MDPAIQLYTKTILDGDWQLYAKACEGAGLVVPTLVWNPDPFAIADWRLNALYADWKVLAEGIDLDGPLQHILEKYSDMLAVLARRSDDIFTYDRYGQAIAAVTGHDLTGKTTRSTPTPLAPFFEACYHAALARDEPLLTVHRPTQSMEAGHWLRLILPAPMDGNVRRLLVGIVAILH